MRCRAALALTLLLIMGGCGMDQPRMPATCTDTDAAGYERALRAAPGDVRLAGGVPISECLGRVRTDAELQNLGGVVHVVADRLAARAAAGAGDPAAARQLGYLVGAAAQGAGHASGISAELARRVAIAGVALDGTSPAIRRALHEGQAAGQAHG